MPPTPPKSRKRRKIWPLITAGVVVIIIAAAFVASTFFSHATFTIVPRSIPVAVDSTYIAQGVAAPGTLSYDVITVRASASTTVAAVDGPQVSTKAQGKVTLYNAYSNQAQRLIAGTRLSDSSGRIYRLTGSVVIPGYTQKSGSTIPGTVSAAIQADQAGASYNVSAGDAVSDFKIVAYKGTPRYDTMYGRVAGDITGGFVGSKKTVSPSLLASTTAQLEAQLTQSLKQQAHNGVPSGYIMYDNAFSPVYGTPVVGGTSAQSATVSVSETLYAIILKNDDLVAKAAGSQAASSFGSYGYTAPGVDSLTFTIANPKDFHPDKKTALIFRLKGNFMLVGNIPVDELKHKLAGVPLANTQAILKPYYDTVIESGSGELVPSWSKVPSDLSRITINVEKP